MAPETPPPGNASDGKRGGMNTTVPKVDRKGQMIHPSMGNDAWRVDRVDRCDMAGGCNTFQQK